MEYVCDTNVWYDIGEGSINPIKLKSGGNRLLSPAINLLEISSSLTTNTFAARKQASQAILDHSDEHLEDPERYIGTIWNLNLQPLKFDWRDVCRTIVTSNDIDELINGAQGIMKVNTAAAKAWRGGFTQKFVQDVDAAIRKFVPNYALRRQNGRMNYLRNANLISNLHNSLNSRVVREAQILTSRSRASCHMSVPPGLPSQSEIDIASAQLMPFVRAYLTFIERAATVQAASPNDWGDLHCFVYLQDNRKLLTGDKKWLEIASNAGMADLVQDSKAI